MEESYPILEFDGEIKAILNPHGPKLTQPAPRKAVVCFFLDILNDLVEQKRLVEIGACGSEMGRHPLYLLEHNEQSLMVFHPGVGAPLAAGILDEVIALGVNRFIACGGCGALDKHIDTEHPVILTGAVRDEGTSYHYIPPAREIGAHPATIAALETVFLQNQTPYRLGKTWTTDAIYRETPARRAKRVAEGCDVVEMEAAAFFAVAQFRGVQFGQVVYGGDLVIPEGWDNRSWQTRAGIRQKLFWLAVEACCWLD
jgi:uridine phosphorylase